MLRDNHYREEEKGIFLPLQGQGHDTNTENYTIDGRQTDGRKKSDTQKKKDALINTDILKDREQVHGYKTQALGEIKWREI